MLCDPAPRPPASYDPGVAPWRDDDGVVHVHDHATVRVLLRDPHRVTADVTDLVAPGTLLHPVSAFVWATDRRTLAGRPGRHPALRSAMVPWFAAAPACTAEQPPAGPFDVYHDYALPLAVSHLAGWLGVRPSDVTYAVDDQLAHGEFFATWPMLTTPAMDAYYRDLMARDDLSGVAAAARDLVAAGVLAEREAWGVVYSISVSAVATATAITLTVGLCIEHGCWPVDDVGAAVEEAVRLGSPFPQASRFVRAPLRLGDVELEPGDQVLMWLTAANRDLPGPQRQPFAAFDPGRDNAEHLGWGAGYHRCAGAQRARALAAAAVTTLARRHPRLRITAPWRRFVGIDDGYVTAPVTGDDVHRSDIASPRRLDH